LVPVIAAELTFTELDVVFETVMLCAALLDSSLTSPNDTAEGDTVTLPPESAVPVPDNEISCGLAEPLSVMTSVAVRIPAAAGVNTTVMLHVAEGARVVPQVFCEMEKSPVSVPVTLTLLMLIAAVPLLLKVTDCGPPDCPTGTLPHVSELGETVACAAATTVCAGGTETPQPARIATAPTESNLIEPLSDQAFLRSKEHTRFRRIG
jgi:hypothetical protein